MKAKQWVWLDLRLDTKKRTILGKRLVGWQETKRIREASCHHYLREGGGRVGNAFDKLDFGEAESNLTPQEKHLVEEIWAKWIAQGLINHRTPIDLLHILRAGLIKYCVLGFRLMRKSLKRVSLDTVEDAREREREVTSLRKEAEKREKETKKTGICSGLGLSGNRTKKVRAKKGSKKMQSVDDEKATRVFTDKTTRIAEKVTLYIGVYLSNQSDRQLSRTYFPQGALSTDKVNHHEYVGLGLLYLCFLSTTFGDCWFGDGAGANQKKSYTRRDMLGSNKHVAWIRLWEDLLLLDSFLHSYRGPTEPTLQKFELYLELMINHLIVTVDREEGNGFKIPKVHSLFHAADDIRNYGSLRNTNTDVGEEKHKKIKEAVKRSPNI